MDPVAKGQVHRVGSPEPEVCPDFRTIFEEHFDYVWNTLRHLGAREVDLEDLTHEVFLRVHERLEEYDGARPLRPWLFAFAFRVASGHRRLARHRLEILGDAAEPRDASPSADEALALREDKDLATAALEAVELDRRAVFVLHELDEVAIPRVAAALGIPTATAYSRLRLAREEFHRAVHRLRLARGDR
jgi:RNA polymerase sigma-70 factor (ECF subfamily)